MSATQPYWACRNRRAGPKWKCRLLSVHLLTLAVTAFSAIQRVSPVAADETTELHRILQAAGSRGGLVVHLHCGNGKLTAALRADNRYLVQGFDTSAASVRQARDHIHRLGLDGFVSVDTYDGQRLPFADNLVNLIVASEGCQTEAAEIARVLAPRGILLARMDPSTLATRRSPLVPHASTGIGDWSSYVKPWPKEMDEWTHFLHGPSNNAVAQDRLAASPQRLQWMGGPLWSRSHEYDSSLCAMVSARGRLFYIFDEGPTGVVDPRIPDRWTLIARDAFNGIVLWKRPIADWGWQAWKRSEMGQIDWRRMPSQRNRLPLAIARRLVAVGDRVYATLGYRAPVTVLDGATGNTVATYPDTESTEEMVFEGHRLVLCKGTSSAHPDLAEGGRKPGQLEADGHVIAAYDTDAESRLWQTEPTAVVPLSLALRGRSVFYHDQEAVVCLDSATGVQRWRTPTSRAVASTWNADTTLVVYGDVALCGSRKQLVALSVADGRILWQLSGARGFGVVNPPDLLVADGLVWYGQGGAEPASITGYDPVTGKPERTVDLGGLITHGHHARCYRSKATDNYLLLPKRAVEFIDIHGDQHSRHNWVRGACRYGLLPCNGLLYSTPHPCFCYAGVKLNGFLALAPRAVEQSESQNVEDVRSERLVRGPAFNLDPDSGLPALDSAAWPMHRHDARRSGSVSTVVGSRVREVWNRELAGRLTQAVVVGERLFVARVDAGQICCLEAATGKPVWDYFSGGRIDSAPSYYRGRLIFGSADGRVYCLRADDGVLAWQFQAAPTERRVVAFGQVESAWPVHGSVLFLNDLAYFTAGRSSFLDGGMIVYALDPITGDVVHETHLDGPHPDIRELDENAYAMEGAKSDILVTDGTHIYLHHNAFDQHLNQQPTPVQGQPGVRNLGVRNFGEHLFSNAGMLDDSWFNRNYWMVSDRWPAFNFAHQSPRAGQLIVFDDKCTYAVKVFVRRNMLSPQFFPDTDGYYLVADSNETRPVAVRSDGKDGPEFVRWLPQTGELQTCWNLGVGFARSEPAKWISVLPTRIRAMVRTTDVLFAAGPPDVCPPDDPAGALEGRSGAVLIAFDPGDGRRLQECHLDSSPVFDGMSAAGGRLYISTEDGRLLCMGQ